MQAPWMGLQGSAVVAHGLMTHFPKTKTRETTLELFKCGYKWYALLVGIAMVGNYQRVDVDVSVWGPESETNDPEEKWTGCLEEMYCDNGSLKIVITHPDNETVTDVEVPVRSKDSWNQFVESLPTWD